MLEEQLPGWEKRNLLRPIDFSSAESIQRQNPHTSGKGFTDVLHQTEHLRACQKKPAILSIVVNQYFDVRKKLGRVLYFIYDDRGGILLKEKLRIALSQFPNPWIVERYIGHILSGSDQLLDQCRLPGLTCPGDYNGRKVLRKILELSFNLTLDIHAHSSKN